MTPRDPDLDGSPTTGLGDDSKQIVVVCVNSIVPTWSGQQQMGNLDRRFTHAHCATHVLATSQGLNFVGLRRYALLLLVKLEVSKLKLWRLPHHEVEAPKQKT